MTKIRTAVWMSAIAAFCGFTACSSGSDKKAVSETLNEKIIGEWRNQNLKIEIKTANNTEKNSIVEANESNWLEVLKIKPIRTYFKDDGTYHSEYPNANDSIIRRTTGMWAIKGDSITMTQMSPEKDVYRFHLTIDSNIVTFKGNIDFDGDGKSDDYYFGTQKKMQ